MNIQDRITALAIRIAQEFKAIRTSIADSLANYYTKTEVDNKLVLKADKSNTYTKTETDDAINTKISGLYRLKGSKDTYADLPPASSNVVGDVWDVKSTGVNYVWVGIPGGETGDGWDSLSGIVDLTGYYTKVETDAKFELKFTKNTAFNKNFGTAAGTVAQGNDSRFHTHANMSILDGTTASFTTVLKSKLDAIEAGANKFILTPATTTVLGGIIVGDNLTIDSNGKLNSTDTDTTYLAGTKVLIDGGTDTVNRVWSAKILKDAIVLHGGKVYTAGNNIQISPENVISATDTVYVHPTSAGNKHIPTGGAVRQYLKYSSSGTAVWSLIDETDVESNTNYVTIFETALV